VIKEEEAQEKHSREERQNEIGKIGHFNWPMRRQANTI